MVSLAAGLGGWETFRLYGVYAFEECEHTLTQSGADLCGTSGLQHLSTRKAPTRNTESLQWFQRRVLQRQCAKCELQEGVGYDVVSDLAAEDVDLAS